MPVSEQEALIQKLKDPRLYSHLVHSFRVIETHISWVILTGVFAYKIKKAVNLGFLDFSALEKRRFFCEEELRLGSRLAPGLYCRVIPLAASGISLEPGSKEETAEYAIRMRQFDPQLQWDVLLHARRLKEKDMDRLACLIAAFHSTALSETPSAYEGSPECVWDYASQTFRQLKSRMRGEAEKALLQDCEAWMEQCFKSAVPDILSRRKRKRVRECHGDLHLRNIAYFEGGIILFDPIEFNKDLRWIDVLNDAAFFVMDLEARSHAALGWHFLNVYLEHTGDYEDLGLLRFFKCYRALVRSKVAAIQGGRDSECLKYLEQARCYTKPRTLSLTITHGTSGSGKTSLTSELAAATSAVRIRSDVERKRLFGIPADSRVPPGEKDKVYGPEGSRRTYERLWMLAEKTLKNGFPVIADATFLKRCSRLSFRNLAEASGAEFRILDFRVGAQKAGEWIRNRDVLGSDASDAGLPVLEAQLKNREPLEPVEMPYIVPVSEVELENSHRRDAWIKHVAALKTRRGI